MPIVSVIIPTYNRSDVLPNAINSVLNQTYKDLELLVIDDGSTDDTSTVIQQYTDPRFQYIQKNNEGRSIARNTGINKSTGDFIAFLDDDDVFLSEKLEKQVTPMLEDESIDFVASGSIFHSPAGKEVDRWTPWEIINELNFVNYLKAFCLIPSVVLIRSGTIYQLDHWFDPYTETCEDTDFFLRFLLICDETLWVKEHLTKYNLRDSANYNPQKTTSDRLQRVIDKIYALPNLPPSALEIKDEIFTRVHLMSAFGFYKVNDYDNAKTHLTKAASYQNDFKDNLFKQIFIDNIGIGLGKPNKFIESVFNNLPPSLEYLKKYKKEIYQKYLERVVKKGLLSK